MSPRRRAVVLLAAVFALVGLPMGGIAYAVWTAGGGGTGSAASGDFLDVSMTPGTPATTLYPGGQSDVVLTISNPNTSPMDIDLLVLDTAQGAGGFAADAGHPGCDVSALGYTTQSNTGAGWTLPASGTLPVILDDALTMSALAASGCQGATLTVYLAVG